MIFDRFFCFFFRGQNAGSTNEEERGCKHLLEEVGCENQSNQYHHRDLIFLMTKNAGFTLQVLCV